MAGRILLCKLNQGFRQARTKIPLQPYVEFSAGKFSRALNPSVRCTVQVFSERYSFLCRMQRFAAIHFTHNLKYAAEPTFGVGPVMGGDRDPKSKGDTPDDFRAVEIHATEPKEITKEAAARAMNEPPDYQTNKVVPEESKPVEGDADPQRADEEKAFEERTRKQEGTAQYQGETTGTEKSGHEREGQYGAGPDEGKTTRA